MCNYKEERMIDGMSSQVRNQFEEFRVASFYIDAAFITLRKDGLVTIRNESKELALPIAELREILRLCAVFSTGVNYEKLMAHQKGVERLGQTQDRQSNQPTNTTQG